MNISQLLTSHFHLEVTSIKQLDGYENQNFLITTSSDKYVFKTYPINDHLKEVLNAESEVLSLIESDLVPKPIPFEDGGFVKVIVLEGSPLLCRLLTYLSGDLLGSKETVVGSVYSSLGAKLAELDLLLSKINNSVLQSRVFEWDIQHLQLNEKYIKFIEDPQKRNWVKYFISQYTQNVQPYFYELRKQLIHNDANEWNILVNDNEVCGIFDFGDLAYSFTINELAIALTYAAYDKEEPLQWMGPVIKAYHESNPIQKIEIEVLYYLVAARLCISVCNSAYSKFQNPENHYASSSENNAWEMLGKWLKINPLKAKSYFKECLGLPLNEGKPLDEALGERDRYLSKILSVSYSRPIHMYKAAFQYMYDTKGNTFLDAYNNIPHVGHSHPTVVEAGQEQMASLNTNTRYLYDLLPRYAEKLLSRFPKPLSKVFFVNSGSAAADLAIRLAKTHTSKEQLMVVEHGYHGNTQLGIDVSDYKFSNPKGQGIKEHIVKVPIPNSYNGSYTGKGAGSKYAQDVIAAIEGNSLAAFIAEPIVGCGGQVPLAKEYLKAIYPAIRQQGGLCISDEVQTGFGRLGSHFWGFEMHNVIPDIVILGKPIGNGHPLGAVVCTADVAESFEKGVEFFSSFGGNPVSCAIGAAVLDVIEEENLQENALEVGKYYREELKKLQMKHPVLGDIRGEGLFLGIELVQDKNKTPHKDLAQYIKNTLRENHILISTDGPYDNVLKTKPPLCFSKDNVDEVVKAIENSLSSFNSSLYSSQVLK